MRPCLSPRGGDSCFYRVTAPLLPDQRRPYIYNKVGICVVKQGKKSGKRGSNP